MQSTTLGILKCLCAGILLVACIPALSGEIAAPEAATILAQTRIRIGTGSHVADGVLVCNGVTSDSLIFDHDSSTGEIVVVYADTVTLRERVIAGVIACNELRATASSAIAHRRFGVPIPIVNNPLSAASMTAAGAENIDVSPRQVRVISPGNYDQISVGAGATVRFTSGVYHANTLLTGPNSRLEFVGAIHLWIDRRLQIGQDSLVNAQFPPAPLTIEVTSQEPVIIDARAIVQVASMSAPSAMIQMNDGMSFAGVIHADAVVTGNDCLLQTIDLRAPSVEAIPATGVYATSIAIALSCDEPADIYYTIDGSEPEFHAILYQSPIVITDSTVLSFLAVDQIGHRSVTKRERYVIRSPASVQGGVGFQPATSHIDHVIHPAPDLAEAAPQTLAALATADSSTTTSVGEEIVIDIGGKQTVIETQPSGRDISISENSATASLRTTAQPTNEEQPIPMTTDPKTSQRSISDLPSVIIPLTAGWNLISTPLEPADPVAVRRDIPAKIVWQWRNGDYAVAAELHAQVGYWLELSNAMDLAISGSPVGDTVALTAGWNLIGPADEIPLPTHPAVIGVIWWWDGIRYQPAERLLPKKGYWIYALTDAALRIRGDTTLPVIAITGVTDGQRTNQPVTLIVAVTDNDSILSVSSILNNQPFISGATINVDGEYTLSVTATDAAGNVATAVRQFTIDRTPPTLVCPLPRQIMLSSTPANGCGVPNDGNALTTWFDSVNATDLCDPVTISHNEHGVYVVGLTMITFTAQDRCGNQTSCQSTITVVDDVKPTAVCRDATLQLSETGTVSLFPSLIDGNTADACGLSDLSVHPSSFSCPDVGVNSVTLTAIDIHGNSATCQAAVVVSDATAPTLHGLPDNQTVECNQIPESVAVTATDGCDGDLAVSFSETAQNLQSPCAPIAIGSPTRITRTWSATDRSGNTTTAFQSITVIDTVAPVITIIPLITNVPSPSLNGGIDDPTATITVHLRPESHAYTATNHGDGTWSLAAGVIDPPLADGTYNVQAIATDPFGNSASDTTTGELTIDTTHPVITISGVTDNLLTNQPVTLVISTSDPPFVSFVPFVVTLNGLSFDFGTPITTDGNYALSVIATDSAGNISTQSLDFTIDSVPPVLTIPPDLSLACPADLRPEATGFALGTDSCGTGVVAVSYFDENQPGCGETRIITRRWTATDECGNSANAVQTITVVDTTPPSLSCPLPISVTLGDAGPMACSVDDTYAPLASWLNTAITADVCGSVAVTNDHPSTFPVGTTTVTFTATDECENVTACSSSVTLIDNVPPVAVCRDVTIHLDSVGHAAVTADHINSGSTDACGIATVGLDRQTFACADAGMNAVALTVADLSGNIASCNGSITVVDETAPFVVAHDLVVQLDAAGVASIVVADIDSGTSDACGLSVLSVLPSSFTCANVGANTVTLTAVDVNGNTASSTAIVMVEDRILPSAVCREATVNLSETGTVSISSSLIDGNSSDVCGLSDLSISPSSFSCDDVGPNTVTLTAIDIHGSASTCQTVVTVTDDIVPSASVNDLTVQLDANGDAAITVEQIDNGSHDNCGIASTQLDHTTFGCDDVGSNAVTMTVTDDHGNSSTAMATVTVEDRMPPTAVCKDIMIQLDEAGTVSLAASAVGNGSDACGIVALTVNRNTFTCADIGANTVVFTATDVNGNSASCESVVTVRDEILPTVLTRNIAIQLDATGTATITTGDVDSGTSDSCGLSDLSVLPSSFTCADVGANTVTLTAVDVNGNTASSTAIVTVEDRILPSAVCREATVNLSETGTVSISSSLIDGNNSDVCGLSDRSISPSSFSCDDVGPNTVTLTATDVHGNTATCQAVVTVNDGIVPIAAAKDVRIQLDAGGNVAITTDQIDNGSRDNCGIASMQLDRTTFDCDNVGSNAVTMTVTDSHGNVSTATATVTVEDRMAPIVVTQDVTIQLDAAGSATIAPTDIDDGTSDVCGIASLSLDVTDFTCANIGANTVTLSAVDIHGNTASATATVAVEDRVSPTAACQDITIQLDEAGAVSLAVSAIGSGTDACGIATLTLDRDAFTCANIGANTVTLSVADVNGNNATCTAVVTVEDKVVPIAACRDITVQLDSDGAAAITAGQVNNGSADACGIAALGLDRSTFTCSDIGSRTVTLTATDVHGNNASCQANVTVVDTVSPIAVCRDSIVTLNSDGAGTLAADAVNNDVADACGITSITAHPSEFTCANIGANTVTLTVTDVTGNSGGCTSVVTVKDEIVPTVACRDIAVHLDANGTVVIAADQVNNGSMDACGIASLSVTPNTFTCATIGANTATLTVTDIHGNVSMCEAAVTVEDRVAPTALCRDVTVQLDPSGAANILATAVDAGSHDACGISALSVSPSSFSCADVGPSTVTLTATDVHGNTATCQAVVTLTDDVLPNASAKDVTIKLDAGGNAAITTDQIDNGSRDNCGIASMQLDRTTFDCDDVGSNAVIMTVTDNHGNSSTAVATVTVEDHVAPIMVTQDITIQLDAAGLATIAPSNIDNGSSDVCGIASLSLDVTDFTCANVGANTVTLTAVDGNGNTAAATATVAVDDRVPPTVACQDITIQLDEAGTVSLAASAIGSGTDACGIAAVTLDRAAFTCTAIGANTVTLTATDVSGNSGVCTAMVTVQDEVAPVAVCRDVTVQLDATGNAAITAQQLDTGSHDACGILSLSLNLTDFTCANIGANAITLTATDINGNSATAAANVTVEDHVPPLAVCQDITVQLDSSGAAAITTTELNNGSADACGVASLTLDRDAFTCDDIGSHSVTLTATDVNGNSATCTATVVVRDVTAPILNGVPNHQTVECHQIPDSAPVTAADGCDGDLAVSYSESAENLHGTCVPIVIGSPTRITRTWTATDRSGNVAAASQIITVVDTVSPVVTVTPLVTNISRPGLTGEIDDSTAAITVHVGQELSAYTATNHGDGTWSLAAGVIDPALVDGTHNVRAVATDSFGNSASDASTGELIIDTVPPAITISGVTDNLLTNQPVTPPISVTDPPFVSFVPFVVTLNDFSFESGTPITTDGNYTLSVIATDLADNRSTRSLDFTIDRVPPVLIIPADQTLECPADLRPEATGFASGTDSCGTGSVAVSYFDESQPGCGETRIITRRWTGTDECGNAASAVQAITVADTIPPSSSCPLPISVTLGDAHPAGCSVDDTIAPLAAWFDAATAADACGSVAVTNNHPSTFPVGTTTVTFTAEDACGNRTSCESAVTVVDDVLPTAVCTNLTVQLDENGSAGILAGTTGGENSDACGVASLALDRDAFTCANVGANTVTLTVTDVNGNSANCTATATVQDSIAPVAACQDITVQLDASGNASTTADQVNDQSSDACGIANLALDVNSFTCAHVGANTATLTVTDVNGNSATCETTVTVNDPIAPVVLTRDITIRLDASGTASIAPADIDNGTSDVCGIASLSLDVTAFSCADVGVKTVTLTARDVNGNTASRSAMVTVEDRVLPIATCRDATVQLNAVGNASITAEQINNTSTDACGIVSLGVTPNTFGCGQVGANMVTLTVTDMNGNSATCTATVTVQDQVAPIAACQEITVQLDAAGEASVTADLVNIGSTDACGIASTAVTPNVFGCGQVGANTVTLSVTDANDNSANCTATVTVQDSIAPVAVCQDITVQLDASGNASITAAQINNASSDACGIASLEVAPNVFGCADVGANTVSLTIADNHGNGASCEAVVSVRDVTAPILNGVPNDQTVECDEIPVSATVTATDGCDGDLAVSFSEISENLLTPCAPIVIGSPISITRTWTATDRSGNVATASQTITVVDTVSPVVTVTPLVTNISRPGLTGEIDDSTAAITVRVGQESPAYTATNHGDGTWSLAAGVIDPALVDGTHNVQAVATDSFGNSASDTTAGELTIDTTPPVITISGVTDNLLTNQPVTPIIAVTDPPFVSFVPSVVTLNDFSFESGTPITTDGHYSLTVLANDLAGNISRRSMDFAIDTTSPAITIAAPLPDLVTNRLDARLEGTITDAHLADLFVNAAAVTVASDGSFSYVSSLPKEGSNNITIGAKDRLGQATTVQRTIVRDTIGPTLAVDGSAAPLDTNLATVVFTGTVDAGTIRVSARGVDAIPTNGRFVVETPLSEGANRIRIVAVDAAGNQTVADRDVNRDSRAPTISVLSPSPAFLTNTPSTVVRGMVDDATAIVSVNNATVVLAAGAFAHELLLVEGDNVVRVHAADRAGNMAGVEVSGRLDRQGPRITIQSPADGLVTRAGAVTVSGTVDDPAAEVTINGNTPALVNGSFQTELALPGASGAVDVVVTARDPAGNAATQATHVVRDLTPPIISIFTPTEHQVLAVNTATIQGDVDDNAATVTVNGVTATVSNRRFTLAGLSLAEGSNTLVAVATDAVGNRSAEVIQVVTVDTIAPVAPALDSVSAFVNSDRITLTGTVESGATITILGGLVGKTVVAGTDGRFVATVLLTANTTTVLELTARDTAGNVGAPTTVTVVSDLVPPTLVLTSPIAWDAITTWEGHSVPRLFSPFLAVSGYAVDASSIASLQTSNQAVSLNADGTFATVLNLQPGRQLLAVRAVDLAGNVAEIRFDVDMETATDALPVITVYSPLYDAPVSSTAITILATITDPTGVVAVRVNGSSLEPLSDYLQDFYLSVPAMIDANGLVTIQAENGDGATATAIHRVILDDNPPPAPAVSVITPGVRTNNNRVTLRGTAEPNAFVILDLQPNVEGGAAVDSSGQFSIGATLSANALNTIDLRSRDAAGNISPSTVVEIVHDSDPPAVVSVVPSDGSVGVPPSSTITVTFSEPIHSDTLAGIMWEAVPPGDSVSFSLQSSINNDQSTLVLTSTSPFPDSARVTLTIPNSITDLAGNTLQVPIISSFTVLDATAPAAPVLHSLPAFTNAATITLTGTTEPNTTVTLDIRSNVGTDSVGDSSGTADSTGQFAISVELFPNAVNTIELVSIDTAGNQSLAIGRSVTHDSILPSVHSVFPSSGAFNVPVDATITITFSEPLDADSVAGITWEAVPPGDSFSFSLQSSVSNQQSTILLTPSSLLLGDTTYSVTVPTTIRDRAGNFLAASFTSTFTTVDNVPPASPILEAIPALTRHSSLVISGFSTPGTRINVGGALGVATVDVGSTGLFSLSISLAPNTRNQLQISARDTAGNQSPVIRHDLTQDSAPPAVVKTMPQEGDVIAITQSIFIEFSEPLAPTLLNQQSAIQILNSLHQLVSGQFSLSASGKSVTFFPDHQLLPDSDYGILMSREIHDLAGNALAESVTINFTTVAPATINRALAPNLTSPPPAITQDSSITLTGFLNNVGGSTAADSSSVAATIAVLGGSSSANAAVAADGTFSITVPLSANQENSLLLYATVGGVDGEVTTFTVRHTSHPPGIRILTPQAGVVYHNLSVTVMGIIDSPEFVDVSSIRVEGETVGLFGNYFARQIVYDTPGEKTVTATADSQISNLKFPISTTFSLAPQSSGPDTHPPIVKIVYPEPGFTANRRFIELMGTVEEGVALSSVTCAGVPAHAVLGNIFLVYSELTHQGANEITVVARDQAGLVGQDSVTVFLDDSVPPMPVLAESPALVQQRIHRLTGSAHPGETVVVRGGLTTVRTVVSSDGSYVLSVPLVPNSRNILTLVSVDAADNESDPVEVAIVHDDQAPRVTATSPEAGATGVAPNARVVITFSEPLASAILNQQSAIQILNFLHQPIPGNILLSANNTVLTFVPLATFLRNDTINVFLHSDITDANGFTLGLPYSFSFHTARLQTTVSGVVVDPDLQPLAGILVGILSSNLQSEISNLKSTFTNSFGAFVIDDAPVGDQILFINPTDSSLLPFAFSYPYLEFAITVTENTDNSLGRPIFLVPLDFSTLANVGGSSAGDSSQFPGISDFSLSLAPGSVRFPDGSSTGNIVATRILPEFIPDRLPDGSIPHFLVHLSGVGFQPASSASSAQSAISAEQSETGSTGGASNEVANQESKITFSPLASLTFPNVYNLAIGEKVRVFHFQHGIHNYTELGEAEVGANGLITTDLILHESGFIGIIPADSSFDLTKNYLRGRVVGPDGEGLSGISVHAIAGFAEVRTDDNGEYLIPLPDVRVFELRVYAAIPTSLNSLTNVGSMPDVAKGASVGDSSQSSIRNELIFPSQLVPLNPSGITDVPDIVINTIIVSGSIRFINAAGDKLPRTGLAFHEGNLVSLDDATARVVKIFVFRRASAAENNVGGGSTGDSSSDLLSQSLYASTTASLDPFSPGFDASFSLPIVLDSSSSNVGGGTSGDSSSNSQSSILKVVAFSPSTGWYAEQDLILSSPSSQSEISNLQSQILLDLRPPQLDLAISRVFFLEGIRHRAPVPDGGVVFTSDEFVEAKVNWTTPDLITPISLSQSAISNLKSEISIPARLQIDSFTPTPSHSLTPSPSALRPLSSDSFFSIHGGEHPYILELREALVPDRLTILQRDTDIGIETFAFSPGSSFASDRLLPFHSSALSVFSVVNYSFYVIDFSLAPNPNGSFSISGRALPGLSLTIGDQTLTTDDKGRFSISVSSLPDGGLSVRVGNGPATLIGASLAPILDSLTPSQGSQGDSIILRGRNFVSLAENNNVKFNGAAAQVISATEIELKVIVPNAASAGPVTVTIAGKTSNGLFFDFVSEGLPNGSFETGDLKDFTVSGTVAVITSLGAHNPTHGRFQVWLNTLHDPALGESVLTTDRFVVPEGLEYLIFDYQFLGTKVFNPVREYLELRLIEEGSETLAEGVFPERPPTITENRLSGYAVGNGFQSAIVDVRTYAGQERPIQVAFRIKGIGVIPADKAGSDGGSSLRGTGMLVDNLRLGGSGSLPPAVDQSQIVIGPAVSSSVTITGLAGAVVPSSQVYLQTGQTGDRQEVVAAADGSFALTAAVYDQADSFHRLFYSTPKTTTDNSSNRLFSPSLILRLPAE